MGSHDCSIFDIIRVHSSLEKGVGHADFPPNFTICTVHQDIIDSGEWIAIGDSVHINPSVVIYQPWQHGVIHLGNHEGQR